MENVAIEASAPRPKRKPRGNHFTIDEKKKQCPGMPYRCFHGYTVFEDGHMFGLFGWELRLQIARAPGRRDTYRIKINNRPISVSKAWIIANVFVPNPDGHSEYVFIDGNINNVTVDNIKWVSKADKRNYRQRVYKQTPQQKIDARIKSHAAMFGECESVLYKGVTVLSTGMVLGAHGLPLKDKNISRQDKPLMVTFARNCHQVKNVVADLFLPNPEGHSYVENINGDPKDCRVSNLRWGPHPILKKDTYRTGTQKQEDAVIAYHTANPDLQYTKLGEYVVFEDGTFIGKFGKPKKPSVCIKTQISKAGKAYPHLSHEIPLSHKGTYRCGSTRFIVATLFVPNPDGYQYVAVKDGNLLNVSASNLYWTPKKKPVPRQHLKAEAVINLLSGLDYGKLSDGDKALYDVLNGNPGALLSFLAPSLETFIGWNIRRTERRITWEQAYDIFIDSAMDMVEHIQLGKLIPIYGKPSERIYAYLYLQMISRTHQEAKRAAKLLDLEKLVHMFPEVDKDYSL